MASEDLSGDPAAPKLRSMLLGGDFFLATVVATCLVKLALRSRAHLPATAANMVRSTCGAVYF